MFRKRVQTEHPDVNPEDPEATKRFQDMVAAYNSIMGDELLPDEMMYVRIQQTPRYKKQLNKQVNINSGIFYAFIPGLFITALFAVLLISEFLGLNLLDPDTKKMLSLATGGSL